jgi:hypothetical protein
MVLLNLLDNKYFTSKNIVTADLVTALSGKVLGAGLMF